MATDPIQFAFSNDFQGKMIAPRGEVAIGRKQDEMSPYHLLFGALGACFYSTFLDVVEKKRVLTFTGANLEISGNKRKEVPTTLETVQMKFTIINPSDEKQFLKCAELGTKYCSVHATISKVATIELIVEFVHQ